MVETFTPAGCGGRNRRRWAVVMFTAGSTLAAAAVGAAVGGLGALAGRRGWALAAAAVVALAAALREVGVLRIPVPDLRRQVPESWRRRLPLPVWTTGYGAILGSGFGTYQPAATFWVVLTALFALGDPVVGAVCMGVFGLTRGAMVVLPRRDLLGVFARAHRAIRPVNGAALLGLAIALVPAATAAAALPPDPQPAGRFDLAIGRDARAYATGGPTAPSVVVEPSRGPAVSIPDAWMPALNGSALAVVDADGIRLLNWRTGAELLRIGGDVDAPSLSGSLLAYRRHTDAGATRLELRNLKSGATRLIARVDHGVDLGRPSLSGQVLVWHVSSGAGHRVLLRSLRTGRVMVVDRGPRRYMPSSPVVGSGRIAWLRNDAESTWILTRRLEGGPTRVVATAMGPRHIFTTMALTTGTLYVTRWIIPTRTGQILRYRLR